MYVLVREKSLSNICTVHVALGFFLFVPFCKQGKVCAFIIIIITIITDSCFSYFGTQRPRLCYVLYYDGGRLYFICNHLGGY